MDANNSSSASEDALQYCSVGEAMKLIAHPFDGDKRKLVSLLKMLTWFLNW